MAKQLKIVIVSAYFPPETKGGAEISTYLLAQGLAARGNSVSVITDGEEGRQEMNGVKVYRNDFGLKDKPLREQGKSRLIAKKLQGFKDMLESCEVIHANDFRSVLAVMEWQKINASTKPVVATVRDYACISGSTNFITDKWELPADSIHDAYRSHRLAEVKGLRRWARWWQYRGNIKYRRESFRELDGEIYISKQQAEIIRKQRQGQESKSTIIYNPVDDSYLNSSLTTGYEGKVLYVGTVEEYKGVGLLLNSWRQAAKGNPQATLKIVGEGRDQRKYENYIAAAGMQYSVQMAGRIGWERMIREYDQAQIVVAPHRWFEPFGRTVAEGMARGKVVVTADAGGPREMVRDGETGILFPRNCRDGLGLALKQALGMSKLEKQAMGQKAHAWARAQLNKNHIASLYEDFYKEVIETHGY